MKIKEYYRPENLEEAYEIVEICKGTIIGGGSFLNLTAKEIDCAVDISKLNLNFISEKRDSIEIGALTTLRKIETSDLLKKHLNGILPNTVSCISGIQVRNIATIGGTVWGKYGFSDLLTSLLCLDADVTLYKNGKISLEKFLETEISPDILTSIEVKKQQIKACYMNMRNNSTDFSILNAAVSRNGSSFRICIGSRPMRAKTAYKAMDFINSNTLNEEIAKRTGDLAAESLHFGSDMRSSDEYRKELCRVLVKRCLMEVF